MYSDASGKSRPLETIEVNTKQCVGSSLIFAAWIADLSGVTNETPNPVKPEVIFKIYGVDKDTNTQTLLQSTLSEVIPGRAEWMQVYADVVLQSNIANIDFDYYRVSIDNYSKGTKGADYAIDDIRMFIKKSAVDMIPSRPFCGNDSTTIKVESAYDMIIAKLGILNNETRNIRYSIVEGNNPDNKIVLGIGEDNQPIYYLYDTLNGDYANDTITRRDKYETRNGTNYFIFNKELKVKIEPDVTYYLLVDYQSSILGNTTGSWITSNINDICSIVSSSFKVGRATIEIEELDGQVDKSFTIECNDTDTKLQKMSTYLNVPDGDGGYHKFEINFDWYMKGIMPKSLVTALKNLRASYPADDNGDLSLARGVRLTGIM